MIGMPVGSGSLPWLTAWSLACTLRACDREKIPVRVSAPVGSSVVTWARDHVVGEFLRSDCSLLFWIDADIAWQPKDFFRLLGFAAVHDLIGATYPLKRDGTPTFVVNVPDADSYEINGHGNIRIKSMALGFTVCQRRVIEAVAATKVMLHDPIAKIDYPEFFRLGHNPVTREPLGEDIAFYEDAAAFGFTGWLDPSITLEHIGGKSYSGDVIAALGLEDHSQEIKQ
jgi:hypothetical protein